MYLVPLGDEELAFYEQALSDSVPKMDPDYVAARNNLLAVLDDLRLYKKEKVLLERLLCAYAKAGSKKKKENVDMFKQHFGLSAEGADRSFLGIGLDFGLSAATAQRRVEEVISFVLCYLKKQALLGDYCSQLMGMPRDDLKVPYLFYKMPSPNK